MPKDGLTFKQRIRAKIFEKQIFRPMTPPVIATVKKPLVQCKVALVTTGGIHLITQQPFVTAMDIGDHTFRLIPRYTPEADLTVTHGHYDETDVRKDVNCLLPMDRLEELVKEGFVGDVASNHISFMGYIPHASDLVEESAPAAARLLAADGVDIVVLSPG